jgi:hypothetical protein
VLESLRLAAELEARMETFSYFSPGSGERFNLKYHSDENDDSVSDCVNADRPRQSHPVALTLMFGVTGKMAKEEEPLVYAKATVSRYNQM